MQLLLGNSLSSKLVNDRAAIADDRVHSRM
jgi:hypothetical protein